ncbi:MAG: porin family protein [Candidatus Zixiibacteriota bacterium]
MRQIVLLLLVSLLFAVTVSADSQIRFGVKAGATMANMSGDGWDAVEQMETVTIDKKALFGVAGGLSAEMYIGTSGVSIQPEVLYVTKGAKGETTEADDDTYTVKLKNDYIEVPVLVKYNFTSTGSASPFMFVGPVAAFNIASKYQVENPPADDPNLGDKDIDNAKSLDFGLTIGGGLGLAVGQSGKVTFDLRYTVGLGVVFEDAGALVDGTDKINIVDDEDKALEFKNNDFRLMVGFQF